MAIKVKPRAKKREANIHVMDIIAFTVWTSLALHITALFRLQPANQLGQFPQVVRTE